MGAPVLSFSDWFIYTSFPNQNYFKEIFTRAAEATFNPEVDLDQAAQRQCMNPYL